MEIYLRITGFLLIFLALIHVIFPSYFNWDKELSSLSLINRQMMYIHTFFIAFVVFLMGWFCITSSEELIQTTLGKKFALGLSIFWALRLFVQFFGYSSKLWKGKRLETTIHVLFSLLWTSFSLVFFMVYWQ